MKDSSRSSCIPIKLISQFLICSPPEEYRQPIAEQHLLAQFLVVGEVEDGLVVENGEQRAVRKRGWCWDWKAEDRER